jgi:hypothetical protein
MPKDEYAGFEALNPFFEIVQEGLRGLVDGEIISILSPPTHYLSFAIPSPVGL